MTDQQKQALAQITAAAVASEKRTGCPAELAGSQAILETGWLKSAPQNNCFGIKAYKGCPGRQFLRTLEWFNAHQIATFLALGDGRTATLDPATPPHADGRRLYHVQDWFATFPALGDCFAKRAEMWDKGVYARDAIAFKQDRNLEKFIRAIAPIYATDPHYADSVLKIIHSQDFQLALTKARA